MADITADTPARIVTMPTMVAVPIGDTAQMKRLTEFAADVSELADRRRDAELRELVYDVHADLMRLTEEDE